MGDVLDIRALMRHFQNNKTYGNGFNENDLLNAFRVNKKVGLFGIDYLDRKLDGIHLGDLILIGARSGAGKSAISRMIAQKNPSNTALFCLENFKYDMFLEQAYYRYLQNTQRFDVSLREFAGGGLVKKENWNENFVKDLAAYGRKQFDGLTIYTRKQNYTTEFLIDDMTREVKDNHKQILIIDHLDYVDKISLSENDIEHFTILMKAIRELQDQYTTAVVAISHLRKPLQQKDSPRIPSMDEFYGSSNKVKESTVVIMFAPDDEQNQRMALTQRSYIKKTWCCVRKLRLGGIDNKAVLLDFNLRTGRYEGVGTEYTVNYSGTKIGESNAGQNGTIL